MRLTSVYVDFLKLFSLFLTTPGELVNNKNNTSYLLPERSGVNTVPKR